MLLSWIRLQLDDMHGLLTLVDACRRIAGGGVYGIVRLTTSLIVEIV